MQLMRLLGRSGRRGTLGKHSRFLDDSYASESWMLFKRWVIDRDFFQEVGAPLAGDRRL
jgi:hypothetical protein